MFDVKRRYLIFDAYQSITIYFVPPNDLRMHCDLFWEKANWIASFGRKNGYWCTLYSPFNQWPETGLKTPITNNIDTAVNGQAHARVVEKARGNVCQNNISKYGKKVCTIRNQTATCISSVISSLVRISFPVFRMPAVDTSTRLI